jgi:hypothetical protein
MRRRDFRHAARWREPGLAARGIAMEAPLMKVRRAIIFSSRFVLT